jgi:hypothetical protein
VVAGHHADRSRSPRVKKPTVPRNFAILQVKIEEAVAKLKDARDPFLRRELLRDLRRLLDEADRAIELNKPKAN